MSGTTYIVDILLILIVFRQLRTSPLTASSVAIPLVIVGFAAIRYLKGFTPGGNDLALIVGLTVVGIVLGSLSAMTTRVWRIETGTVFAKASIVSAALWVLGMGFRFGFDLYSNTRSGEQALIRFSHDHQVTSGQAWVTALVLMAVGEVLSRVVYLQVRRFALSRAVAPSRAMAAEAAEA